MHHFTHPRKLSILARLRQLIGRDGVVVFYEDASPDSEDRNDWLRRWDLQEPLWTAFTPAEWQAVRHHVRPATIPRHGPPGSNLDILGVSLR